MLRLFNALLFSADLVLALFHRAVDHFFVAALCVASGGNFVLSHCLTGNMRAVAAVHDVSAGVGLALVGGRGGIDRLASVLAIAILGSNLGGSLQIKLLTAGLAVPVSRASGIDHSPSELNLTLGVAQGFALGYTTDGAGLGSFALCSRPAVAIGRNSLCSVGIATYTSVGGVAFVAAGGRSNFGHIRMSAVSINTVIVGIHCMVVISAVFRYVLREGTALNNQSAIRKQIAGGPLTAGIGLVGGKATIVNGGSAGKVVDTAILAIEATAVDDGGSPVAD